MSQINQVGGGVQPQVIQQQAPARDANAPAELRGARPSGWAIAGRVLAGIVTVGISEGIRAIVRHVRAGRAPEPRVNEVGIPPAHPQADVANRNLMRALEQNTLPPQYQAAVNEAIGDLRSRYGEGVLPHGTTLENMPRRYTLQDAIKLSIHEAKYEVTPEVLRAFLVEKGAPLMAEQILTGRIGECCTSIGYGGAKLDIICQWVLKNNPELAAGLQTCTDSVAANAVIDQFIPSIEKHIQLRQNLSAARDQANQHALTEFAQRIGVSEESIRQKVNFGKLKSSLNYLEADILTGERPLHGDGITEAFIGVANSFVEQKAALFKSVDGLSLSQNLKDDWKRSVLKEDTLSKGDMLATFHAVGSSVDARKLLEALKAPAGEFSDREILGLMESLGADVTTSLVKHYGPQGWTELGGDGQGNARFYAVQAMLDAVPGLMAALASRPEQVARLMDMAVTDFETGQKLANSSDAGVKEQGLQLMSSSLAVQSMVISILPSAAEHNESLAASLGKPDMPPAHAQALDRAIVDMREKFGADSLPAGGTTEVLRAWDRQAQSNLSGLLAAELRASTSSVDSAQFAAMFAAKAKGVAVYGAFLSVLGEMAQKLNRQLDSSNIAAVASALAKRHPDLMVLLSRAENRAGVAELLTHLPEAASLLRVEYDVQTAWNRALEHIQTGMVEATGLSMEHIQEHLSLETLKSGRFSYLQKDIRDQYAKFDVSVDDLPTSEYISNEYHSIADRFLTGKKGLYASIDGLGLSPELTASWKAEVLTNPVLRDGEFLHKCANVAQRMNDYGLSVALGEPLVNDGQILGLFRAIGGQLDEQAHAVFSVDEFRGFGSDELGALNSHARDAFLDRHPGLVVAMRANAERMHALFVLGEDQLSEIQRSMSGVTHDSPQMAAIQAEYASIASALSIISTVVRIEE